ncbi:MAG: crossover junction endodeoxyribonuclease RuvC [Phycisphaerales bacterium JB037]
MRILGIDPGLRITGYGCVDARGHDLTLVEAGVFKLGKGRAPGQGAASVSERLAELDTDFRELLERLEPEVVGVEALFAHYAHPATAIVMGHARGVLLLAIRRAGARLVEFKPALVKNAITGHGRATKDQMQSAIQGLFGLAEPPDPPDVADALAVAVCAARRIALGLDAARSM